MTDTTSTAHLSKPAGASSPRLRAKVLGGDLSAAQWRALARAVRGSPDRLALEELKHHNSAVAATILSAWDAAGLLTERNYLRRRIRQAQDAKTGQEPQRSGSN